MTPKLTDRQRRILARLVAEYIEQGEPVSSAWLAEHSALGLSSATVRNILARLEEQGLVHQPHTSAGRVPTDSGYRLYVDGCSARASGRGRCPKWRRACAAPARSATCSSTRRRNCRGRRIRSASRWRPPSPTMRLQHIDFVSLDGSACSSSSSPPAARSRTRSSRPPSACDAAMLSQAANYINARVRRPDAARSARRRSSSALRQERVLYDALVARALELAQHRPGRHRRRRDAARAGRVVPRRRARRRSRAIASARWRRCARCSG